MSIHQLPPRPKRPGCSSKFTSTAGTHCTWQEGKLGAPKFWQVLSESRFLLPIDFVIMLPMQGVLFQIDVHSEHDALENDLHFQLPTMEIFSVHVSFWEFIDSDSELLSTSFQGKNIVGPCDIWRFPPPRVAGKAILLILVEQE